jgi:NAD(P)-dependent dehydrogenase (short-subunit alcohol dehydrogenase family)
MKLQGKRAIVTGAAQGIGLACAKRLAAEGAHVMLSDITASGSEAANSIGQRFTPCDVGDSAQVNHLVAETVKAFGGVDILINNAGIIATADFLDISEADFDRVIRVNLKGAFLTAQACARQMVEQVKAGEKPGSIINMSSVNAELAIPNQVPYTVSKGGLKQLTKIMALALAPHGIRTNAIGPGSIMTDILKSVANNPEVMNRIYSRTPLGRVGDPEEIAAIAAFLASDDASYITGQSIYADGGRMALNYTVPIKT